MEKKVGAVSAANEEKVDLGGGSPVGLNALQSKYDTAMLNSQGFEADQISRQAHLDGIKLDRFSWLTRRDKG